MQLRGSEPTAVKAAEQSKYVSTLYFCLNTLDKCGSMDGRFAASR